MRDYEIMCSVICREVTQGLKYLKEKEEREKQDPSVFGAAWS